MWPPRVAPELQQILKAAEAFEAELNGLVEIFHNKDEI